MFKAYGYSADDPDILREFGSVSLCFDQTGLEEFAAFVSTCAAEMAAQTGWDHVHFRGEQPDIVIAKLADETVSDPKEGDPT